MAVSYDGLEKTKGVSGTREHHRLSEVTDVGHSFERSDSCVADDMPIQSQSGPIEDKEDKGLNSVKYGKIRKQSANKIPRCEA